MRMRMRFSWRAWVKKSFTVQPARPEEAQAHAQAHEEAQAQDDAQDEAQEDRWELRVPAWRVPALRDVWCVGTFTTFT